MRRDAVHGLTTAATIWLTAGVGMAAGAGLAGLAAAVTALYFVALYGFLRRLPKIGIGPSTVRVTYEDGCGVLRQVLEVCTSQRFNVSRVTVGEHHPSPGVVDVELTRHKTLIPNGSARLSRPR